jgi:hypothetical protein
MERPFSLSNVESSNKNVMRVPDAADRHNVVDDFVCGTSLS